MGLTDDTFMVLRSVTLLKKKFILRVDIVSAALQSYINSMLTEKPRILHYISLGIQYFKL